MPGHDAEEVPGVPTLLVITGPRAPRAAKAASGLGGAESR